MQKFNNGCISDFLLPGMGKEQILRYCEIPVLIKDAIQDGIKSYVQKGYIEDMFPLHDIVSWSGIYPGNHKDYFMTLSFRSSIWTVSI